MFVFVKEIMNIIAVLLSLHFRPPDDNREVFCFTRVLFVFLL